MNIQNSVLGVGVLIALVVGLFALGKAPAQPPAGSAAGPDKYEMQRLHADEIVGGNTLATSSIGAVTYPIADIMNNRLITHTAASALTATLPASTTFAGYLPNTGDSKTTCINAITTKITLAAGTGIILSSASTTDAISQGQIGCVTFVRKANTDISALLIAD